jgi:hypothetical protein
MLILNTHKNNITLNRIIFLRKFTVTLSDNNENMCRYCKNRILTLDRERFYSDRCKKFIVTDNKNINITYELAYNARKDEDKCGKLGKYYKDKYFT